VQSQLPDAFTNPLTTLNLTLGIIIVVGQVLIEILLGHSDVLLRYAAKHTAGNLPPVTPDSQILAADFSRSNE
jgi:hypothetical protein